MRRQRQAVAAKGAATQVGNRTVRMDVKSSDVHVRSVSVIAAVRKFARPMGSMWNAVWTSIGRGTFLSLAKRIVSLARVRSTTTKANANAGCEKCLAGALNGTASLLAIALYWR